MRKVASANGNRLQTSVSKDIPAAPKGKTDPANGLTGYTRVSYGFSKTFKAVGYYPVLVPDGDSHNGCDSQEPSGATGPRDGDARHHSGRPQRSDADHDEDRTRTHAQYRDGCSPRTPDRTGRHQRQPNAQRTDNQRLRERLSGSKEPPQRTFAED